MPIHPAIRSPPVAAPCRCCHPTLARSSPPSPPAYRSPPRSRSRASPRSPRSRPPPTALRPTETTSPASSRSPTCPARTCARSLPVHTPPARWQCSPASRRPPATHAPAPRAAKSPSAAPQRASGAPQPGLAELRRAARGPPRRSRRPPQPRQRTRPPPRTPSAHRYRRARSTAGCPHFRFDAGARAGRRARARSWGRLRPRTRDRPVGDRTDGTIVPCVAPWSEGDAGAAPRSRARQRRRPSRTCRRPPAHRAARTLHCTARFSSRTRQRTRRARRPTRRRPWPRARSIALFAEYLRAARAVENTGPAFARRGGGCARSSAAGR